MNSRISLFGLCLAIAAALPGSAFAQTQSGSSASTEGSTQGRSTVQSPEEEQFGLSSEERRQRSQEAVGAGQDTEVDEYMRGRLGEEPEHGEQEGFGDRP